MKKDALQKGLPAPDEAAVRELVLAKNVEAPDLATVKDFLRFKAAAGKGMIAEQTTLPQSRAAAVALPQSCVTAKLRCRRVAYRKVARKAGQGFGFTLIRHVGSRCRCSCEELGCLKSSVIGHSI